MFHCNKLILHPCNSNQTDGAVCTKNASVFQNQQPDPSSDEQNSPGPRTPTPERGRPQPESSNSDWKRPLSSVKTLGPSKPRSSWISRTCLHTIKEPALSREGEQDNQGHAIQNCTITGRYQHCLLITTHTSACVNQITRRHPNSLTPTFHYQNKQMIPCI